MNASFSPRTGGRSCPCGGSYFCALLLLVILSSAGGAAQASLTSVDLGLPGLVHGTAVWVDYDNDGDLDLILVGFEDLQGDRLSVWRNDKGAFSRVDVGLPTVAYGTPAWGDFDNDGDLDVALLVQEPLTYTFVTEIWRNDAGHFTRADAFPYGKFGATIAWMDWDGDGDLDLCVNGAEGDAAAFHVLRNDRGSFVVQSFAIDAERFAVADFDGDGDADVAAQGTWGVRVWRNDNGVLVDSGVGLAGVVADSMAWVDADQDGDLDLWIGTVNQNQPGTAPIIHLFRNDSGSFTDTLPQVPSIAGASLAWGDYDNDGRLDLAGVTLQPGATNAVPSLLRNTGSGWADTQMALPFSSVTSAAWGDYDGDGNLDLVLTGADAQGIPLTQAWRNVPALTNSAPSAPNNTSAAVAGGTIKFKWNPASDKQSQALGLSYNLRVGTSPGGIDVVSPEADLLTGRRKVARTGNAGSRGSALLQLSAGTYYWSVQAIDGAFAGGPFSAESSFTVIAPEPRANTASTSDLAATEATLAGEVRAAGIPTDVHFEWGKTTEYGQTTATRSFQTSDWSTVRETLSGLEVGVLYHYRLVATNGGGTASGADHTFTTRWFIPSTNLVGSGAIVTAHAWADYDGDGDQDVVIGSFDLTSGIRRASLWRNDHGVFTDTQTDLPPIDQSFAWGDYNRDGLFDLALSGRAEVPGSPDFLTFLLDNTADGFADSGAALPGTDGAALAWGDFDNDGDLDLVIAGDNLIGQTIQIWRNNGGHFDRVPATFPPLLNPRAFWGDIDGDGDLDLLISGTNDGGLVTVIYRNERGVFADTDQSLPAIAISEAAWGDFDNDGQLDLAVAGTRVQVWRNDKGVFTVAATLLDSVRDPKLAWGDFDNDGDLDLAVSGYIGDQPATKLFRNDQGTFTEIDAGLEGSGPVSWVDTNDDGALDLVIGATCWINQGKGSNTPPTAPDALHSTILNDAMVFEWSPASDAETPSAGLSYDIYVGSMPGHADILAASADLQTGYRRIPQRGRIQGTRAFLSLVNLPLGNYSWSVQAVDTGLAGGKYAPEQSFQFGSGAPLIGNSSAVPGSRTLTLQTMVHPRGLATSVWLEWGTTARYGQSLHLPDLSGETPREINATLTGLNVETVYYYRWATQNSQGITYGPDRTIQTRRFTPLDITPTSLSVTAAAWGDYDRDGDLDLVICGQGPHGPATRIWRNDNGVFVDAGIDLPSIRGGTVAWGDYDHDGYLDLLICGDGLTEIWRNQGGTFAYAASLPGLVTGSAAWGDYDNDGDLDVLLAGWDGTKDITEIWRNDFGAFVPSGIQLPQLAWPHASWVDYDGDGDLDILLIGPNLDPPNPWQSSATELWRNDNGQFTKATIDLPAFGIGSAAWGDYDGDGDLDLVLCFESAASQIRQNRGGVFHDSGARLPAVSNASVSWGDYDGDGGLDLALAGQTQFGPIQQLWHQEGGTFVLVDAGLADGACVAWADFDGDGDLDLLVGSRIWRNDGINRTPPPSPPAALTAQINGNRLLLNWTAADASAQGMAGLTYKFRLQGTTSAQASQIGTPSLAPDNTFSISAVVRGTSTFLDLPDGVYYWTVQAQDSASRESPWASERMVVISADRDGDGIPDAWELAHGLDPARAGDALADSDGDGVTNLQEYWANTDPADPTSLLAVTALEADGSDLLLSFSSARGKIYRIEASASSPHGPWSVILDEIPASGGPVSLRIPEAIAEANKFYRVIAK